MEEAIHKRGQVTIFILVAIIIVSAILIFFLWVKPTYFSETGGKLNFKSCVQNAVQQSIKQLGENAGLADPQFTYQYNGEQFTYLCYTNEYYKTCVVQLPFPKNTFEEQMKLSLKDEINKCYSNSINELKSQGQSVSKGKLEYNVSIKPNVVEVKIKAPTVIGSQSLANFDIKTSSRIYEMLMIATSIVQSEAKYGDTNSEKLMLLYPNYIIDKIKRSDGTTIYIITDKFTKDKFQFASRSLAWPAGYNFK